jgi:predicted nuclease of predicted toxin-antitoxin system
MRLYLDDHLADEAVVEVLVTSGHDVHAPRDRNFERKVNDPVHLARAVHDNRVLLTKNYRDFEELHDLVMACGGHHPGILIVREDNDIRRDMRPRQIVSALHRLEENASLGGDPVTDHCHVLSDYR